MTEAPDSANRRIKVGMIGQGMIFEETYRPFFERVREAGLYDRATGLVEVELAAAASRTGVRAERYLRERGKHLGVFQSFKGPEAVQQLLASGVDAVCIATPDDRHYEAARASLLAGKHVLIEKPSVLRLQELDELISLGARKGVLAKVVYHKLLDPDHKKLRTHVVDGVLQHVNSGYCSLLEPKQISGSQFAEWIAGRNPGTYVAVHYIKLIDFTFFHDSRARLSSIAATGQRGLVGPAHGPTWDSTQLRFIYEYPDGREAAFDIHTSWVNPDNFAGYVEQEVQFRFDNGIWNAHQRKRGVEVCVEGKSPAEFKITPNHHYSTPFLEPWGERSQRGYGIETIERFFREVAFVEHGGPPAKRAERLEQMRALAYNDLSADWNTVATVQALEAILQLHAQGQPGAVVHVMDGAMVLHRPGLSELTRLYDPTTASSLTESQ